MQDLGNRKTPTKVKELTSQANLSKDPLAVLTRKTMNNVSGEQQAAKP